MEQAAPTLQPDPDLTRLLPLLAEVTGRPEADGVTRATTLDGDLGLDCLDLIEIADLVETRFGVVLQLAAEDAWTTVGDILDTIATAGVAS